MYLLEKPVPLTAEGKDELALEIALLEECRQQIVAERTDAPLPLASALNRELEAVDHQIEHLRETLATGELVKHTGLVAAVGSEVTLQTEYGQLTVTIAGPIAATPKRGCISYDSPMGRAIIGAELGDWIEVPWDTGPRRLRVLGIRKASFQKD